MKNRNIPLIIGIALPLIFVGILSLVLFVPSMLAHPQYSFIYTKENSYYNQAYKNYYTISAGKLVLQPNAVMNPATTVIGDVPSLYVYDPKTDTTHQIDLPEAQKYLLDPGPSSPDGYTVTYDYQYDGGGLFFGGGRSYSGYVMKKGSIAKKMEGLNSINGYAYQGNFNFIGWIK